MGGDVQAWRAMTADCVEARMTVTISYFAGK